MNSSRRKALLITSTVSILATFGLVVAAQAQSGTQLCAHGNAPKCRVRTTSSTTTTAPTTTAPTIATTTTTIAAIPTTIGTTTSTAPAATFPSTTTTTVVGTCTGVAMTAGQADIDSHGTGTTFCLTGTHNWTLTPKAGDTLIGPATLDGGNATAHAIIAVAANVTLRSLTIQRYQNGNGTQDGAIHVDDSGAAKTAASGWRLENLNVGFNSASGSGTGNDWTFTGGRFHDNRQEGIGGAMGDRVTINGVEVDHNNFTDTSYTTRNWSCGDEAGGVKWVTDDMHVTGSYIHDNACKGLWSDLEAARAVITGNRVVDNWDEGIFIEISSGAVVTGNTVSGNGLHNYNGGGWGWCGGITISTSGQTRAGGAGTVDVGRNVLSGNCNGITGVDSFRDESPCPCDLANVSVHDNQIAGGRTGAWEDDGGDLSTHNLTWINNTYSAGATFCGLSC